MRDALAKLSKRDREFVLAHSTYGANASNPTDGDFAEALGVNRNTVINRRKRIQALGVPLYPFRGRGSPPAIDRERSVEELRRDIQRLRKAAAERARQAERLQAELAAREAKSFRVA